MAKVSTSTTSQPRFSQNVRILIADSLCRAQGFQRYPDPIMLYDWHSLVVNLFEPGTGLPVVSVVEKIIRPIAVYLLLVYLLRTFGKRILAQLNPFDLVVLLTLSNTVQNAIIGNDTSLIGGVIGAFSLVSVNAVLVRIHYRGPERGKQMVERRGMERRRGHDARHGPVRQGE